MTGTPRRLVRSFVVALMATGLMSIGSAVAWADDESIVIDFVRHGESIDNHAGIIDTTPPGTALDATGEGQASDVAAAIQNEYGTNIAGVFDSEELRAQETAQPLLDALSTAAGHTVTATTLGGLNEIPAGAFEGDPTTSLEGILYLLGPLSWAMGDVLVPDIGDPSVNGVTFDESFGTAVQSIYDGTANATGTANDVAFSSEGAIAVWTLMNVNNPDFSVLLQAVEQTGGFLPKPARSSSKAAPAIGRW